MSKEVIEIAAKHLGSISAYSENYDAELLVKVPRYLNREAYDIDENNLPEEISITHRSLFDDSIQGIAIRNSNAFSFQGHPEASPGPHDINPLFIKFSNLMKDA